MDDNLTVFQLLEAAKQDIAARRDNQGRSEVAREFAVAITEIENAQMRYTRGRAIENGTFAPADLDLEGTHGNGQAVGEGQTTLA